MTLIATPYCTLADMQRLFSTQGVTAFADHDADGVDDTGVTDDSINRATEEINLYAMQFYSAAGLAGSTLINRWCTVLACYFNCELRGNSPPESLVNEYAAIMERLERVRTGELKIPGVAYKSDMRPSFTNMEVDRRFRNGRVRGNRYNSDNIGSALPQNSVGDIPYPTG